jgi:FAD/FMN-containing dehydrogenase
MFTIERNPEVIAAYVEDESSYAGSADGVIRTGDPAVIAQIMQRATAEGVPVTFSARRTSLTGAAVPEGGWIIVLPEASGPEMVTIDAARAEITAPAQVLMSDMELAAERAGFFFAPDPTSRTTCSIAGAVACNASGARSYAFGPTGRWVRALDVVLPSGDRVQLRRGEHPPKDGVFTLALPSGGALTVPCPPARKADLKNALGYGVEPNDPDLLDLFIGSEGTLGYIVSVTLDLLPRAEIFAALVFWDDRDKAVDFVAALQSDAPEGLQPMSCEWFDARALALAGALHPRLKVPKNAQAALFLEQRHPKGQADDVAMAWYEALLDAGAPDDDQALRVSRNKADLEAFRAFRHAVPEAVNGLARQRGLRKLGTDLAYPKGWLHPMVAYYDAALADLPAAVGEAGAGFEAQWGQPLPQTLDVAIFGHIGDNHLHVNLLPKNPAEMAAGKLLYDALARHCAANGGALSGEHGIGKSKRGLLAETTEATQLSAMRAVKAAFDPAWVLGRGNVLVP